MKRNISNSVLRRQYKSPMTKVLRMATEQTIMAASGEMLMNVETKLKDLGGFDGGGDPALAE